MPQVLYGYCLTTSMLALRPVLTVEHCPQWTPIRPLARQFQVGRSQTNQVLRKQFPLRQSAAKTIHRSQGDTLDRVVVDLTSARREAHMHYVALSLVRTLSGLFILQLRENKIHISNEVKQEMTVLRTDRMMHLSLHFPQSHDSIHITFLNVRSLHQHIDLVRHDPIVTSTISMSSCIPVIHPTTEDLTMV